VQARHCVIIKQQVQINIEILLFFVIFSAQKPLLLFMQFQSYADGLVDGKKACSHHLAVETKTLCT